MTLRVNKVAPKNYKRFVNFLIMFFIPSSATLVVGLPMGISDNAKIIIGLSATWGIAMLKGSQYIFWKKEWAEKDSG